MKYLSLFLIFVFLFGCTAPTVEEKNPLSGTTWELTSMVDVREDTTFTFPNSPYDKYISIYGKTHINIVHQDTSRDVSSFQSSTYTVDGNNLTGISKMHPIYDAIGTKFNLKFKIEGDQLIFEYTDLQLGGYHWKSGHHIWKRID